MVLPINKLEKDSTNPKKRKYFMGRHLAGREASEFTHFSSCDENSAFVIKNGILLERSRALKISRGDLES